MATAKQAWVELDLMHLQHLSEAMPHRVEAIIESQGWYTPCYLSRINFMELLDRQNISNVGDGV